MILISRINLTILRISAIISIVILLIIYISSHVDWKSTIINVKTSAMIFDEYLTNFNKSYNETEYSRRLNYFRDSLIEISKLNRSTGAIHGLTVFSDMSKEEIAKMMINSSGLKKFRSDINHPCIYVDIIKRDPSFNRTDIDDLPDVVDWRKKNVIGPILDQQKCAACWAFCIVGLVESMALIQRVEETYTQRSIQEVMDCTYEGNRDFCSGGDISKTMEKLCNGKIPITTEEEYPLTLKYELCRNTSNEGRRIKHFWVDFDMEEIKMQRHLAKVGPIAVVVNAEPWISYKGGIIQWNCVRSKDGNSLDHVAQIVGYDKSGSVPYYIVRNSWGELFGDKGYLKLVMNKNICGIRDEVSRLEVY